MVQAIRKVGVSVAGAVWLNNDTNTAEKNIPEAFMSAPCQGFGLKFSIA